MSVYADVRCHTAHTSPVLTGGAGVVIGNREKAVRFAHLTGDDRSSYGSQVLNEHDARRVYGYAADHYLAGPCGDPDCEVHTPAAEIVALIRTDAPDDENDEALFTVLDDELLDQADVTKIRDAARLVDPTGSDLAADLCDTIRDNSDWNL